MTRVNGRQVGHVIGPYPATKLKDAREEVGERLLRLPEVLERVPLSRASVYRLMSEGAFPRSVRIGRVAVAWRERDLDAYLAQRIGESAIT
jgi:prophage regulatory protein